MRKPGEIVRWATGALIAFSVICAGCGDRMPSAARAGKTIAINVADRSTSSLGLGHWADTATISDVDTLDLRLSGAQLKMAASYIVVYEANGRYYNVEIRSEWLSKAGARDLALRLREKLVLPQTIDAKILDWYKNSDEPSAGFGGDFHDPSVRIGVWRGVDRSKWSVSITLFFDER